ncbi:MAG TPA: hypothetical protein VJ742_12590 [Nitrososphaera sp.]|nr:hypothetical protein [Nitrososphaera sp.]
MSKLNEFDVEAIIELAKNPLIDYGSIASAFGVSQAAISAIALKNKVRRRTTSATHKA